MLNYVVKEMQKNAKIFHSLLHNSTQEEYVWKSHESIWCLLEIVCHLVDEEVLDFRTRLKNNLENPGKKPPLIDPEGWVKSKEYLKQDFSMKVAEFLEERENSIKWLLSLESPSLENYYEHPELGPLNGHLFLHNWLAHDYLHIKQIVRLKYDYLAAHAPVSISYAGVWT